MDTLANLAHGLAVAAEPTNLLFVFLGAVVGTLFGAFPGLSAPTAIALLLPLTFSLNPTTAIIMLAGIYYGSQFGNSISAVLIGVPGDSAAVVTALEGYKMTHQGRAGPALAGAAVASFGGGMIAVAIFILLGPPLAWVGLRFGPPELAALIVLAFCTLPALAPHGKAKMVVSCLLGLFIGIIGLDQFTSKPRFVFGQPDLLDGVSFVVAVIGLFGVGDVIYAGSKSVSNAMATNVRLRDLWPSKQDRKVLRDTTARSGLLGFLVGILPGAGATIAAFAAYAMERGLAKDKSTFGKGRLEGVAAAEAANSAASIGAMLPMIVLGIPGSGSTAVMLGGFLIWGLDPGPAMFRTQPDFVWGLIGSMIFGNAMLLLMCTLLVPLFAKILRLPYPILASVIVVFCAAGAYAVNQSIFDVWLMLFFALLGYVLRLADISLAPLTLGLVLGKPLEQHLRNSLQISDSGMLIFLQRPICVAILAITVLLLAGTTYASYRNRSKAAAAAGGEDLRTDFGG